jgi:hypothetical protein
MPGKFSVPLRRGQASDVLQEARDVSVPLRGVQASQAAAPHAQPTSLRSFSHALQGGSVKRKVIDLEASIDLEPSTASVETKAKATRATEAYKQKHGKRVAARGATNEGKAKRKVYRQVDHI